MLTPPSQDGSGAIAMMTLDKRGKTLTLALLQKGFPVSYGEFYFRYFFYSVKFADVSLHK